MVSRDDESRRQQHEIRPVSDLPVDDAFDYSGYDFDDAGNGGTRTPRNTDSRLEEEGNAIRRSPPRYGNLLQPDDNNNASPQPQRNVSFKQPGKRISFATPTPENESPQSQSSSSVNRSPRIREEVETFEDDDDDNQSRRDDKDEVIARHPSVMKRHRWGTQRHKKGRPKRSKSIFKSKRMSTASKLSDNHHNNTSTEDLSETPAPTSRKIYVNMPLPYDMLDDDTGLPAAEYPRNKIRTTKYTPLSFIPKNLFYQFQNVANIFFLFIAILGVSSSLSNLSSANPVFFFSRKEAKAVVLLRRSCWARCTKGCFFEFC
jgi:hypothetical protein